MSLLSNLCAVLAIFAEIELFKEFIHFSIIQIYLDFDLLRIYIAHPTIPMIRVHVFEYESSIFPFFDPMLAIF